jgi:hypothetical protein
MIPLWAASRCQPLASPTIVRDLFSASTNQASGVDRRQQGRRGESQGLRLMCESRMREICYSGLKGGDWKRDTRSALRKGSAGKKRLPGSWEHRASRRLYRPSGLYIHAGAVASGFELIEPVPGVKVAPWSPSNISGDS